jgi:tyrosyl-tRNA synthetase
MYGKLMSLPDAQMIPYFEHCTLVPLPETRRLEADLRAGAVHPRDVKKRLAREITAIYHGEAAAREAEQEFERVFAAHQLPDEIPDVPLSRSRLRDGAMRLVQLLRELNLVASNGEARRLINQGGVSLDSQRIDDVNAEVHVRDGLLIRVGRRRFARVRLHA